MSELISPNIYFDNAASKVFFEWTEIDLQGVTWQGHFQEDFYLFWASLFENAEINIIFKRLEILIKQAKIGPLYAWFDWLRTKFIIYCFIYREFSVLEISHFSNLNIPHILFQLRFFFIKAYPDLDNQLAEVLDIPHVASEKIHLKFSDLLSLGITKERFQKTTFDDPMKSLEITLYPEWEYILKKIKSHSQVLKTRTEKVNLTKNFAVRFLIHFIILTLVGMIIIFIFQYLGKYNELVLAEQFEVFEPTFTWLDKRLIYKDKNAVVAKEDIKSNFDEIEQIISKELENYTPHEEERFDTESEVVLTSWDSIPKEIDSSDSDKVEGSDSGFRDMSTGNKKVYRLMMKSVVPLEAKQNISRLIDKYQAEKGDKSELGKFAPGGIYFNLFLPKEYLKEFLAQVYDTGDSVLYESKTSVPNPPGKIRVLIWIKNI